VAENYSLGSKFGFNIASPTKGLTSGVNINTANDLFDIQNSKDTQYENVFNGSIAEQINMYSRQAMIVGMNLKAAEGEKRNFDMNI